MPVCWSARDTLGRLQACSLPLKGKGLVLNCTIYLAYRVRKQVVNVPSFVVRLDSAKHIDFSMKSPYGGGRAGRVKRKNQRKATSGGAGGDEDDDEEEED